MAKVEYVLQGSFDDIVAHITEGVLADSSSASLEDGSNIVAGGVRCAVRVFERFSLVGSSRVAMSVTMVSDGGPVYLSAITAGGSQALFFKMNTIGERSFLNRLNAVVAVLQHSTQP